MIPKLRPFQGEVLIQLLAPPKETDSGIALPDKIKTTDRIGRPELVKGRVLELGAWPQAKKDGRLLPYDIRRGDLVFIDPSLGKKLRETNLHFRIIDHTAIAAVAG